MMPATVRPVDRWVEASPPGAKRSVPVRYTEKTKVVATALKAADPQSQRAHSIMGRVRIFVFAGPEDAGVEDMLYS